MASVPPVHDRLPSDHDVTPLGSRYRHTYRARCSCGWVGADQHESKLARDDHDEHAYIEDQRAALDEDTALGMGLLPDGSERHPRRP